MLTDQNPNLGRRALLSGALLGITGLGLSACGSSGGALSSVATTPQASVPATTDAVPAVSTGGGVFEKLEQQYQANLGVYAMDTDSGQIVAYRADERFAMCSTYKLLAVGAVLDNGTDGLTEQLSYTKDDLVEGSPITQGHTSMSLGDLCAAALQYSDNTAANLILDYLGGPNQVTQFAQALGDQTTRLDRIEPELNEAAPGDDQDTTTPEMIGNDLFSLLAGGSLSEVGARKLKEWMLGNTTGDGRIRAGVPNGWKVADKTGTGFYGTANDVAVVYPKGGKAPIVISIFSSKDTKKADADEQLLAEATTAALAALKTA
jgi:beta-lactamase class A